MEFGDHVLLKSLASFAGIPQESKQFLHGQTSASPGGFDWSPEKECSRSPATVRITRRNSSYTRLSPSGRKRRFRHSTRLEAKSKAKRVRLQVENGPAGYFDLLPTELTEKIYMTLDLPTLGRLALTSKHMMTRVMTTMKSRACLKQILVTSFSEQTDLDHGTKADMRREINEKMFRMLGVLMKRTTCLTPTYKRLAVMVELVERVDDLIDHSNCSSSQCSEVGMLAYYGIMMQAFIGGWDGDECDKVMTVVDRNFSVDEKLRLLHANPVGTVPRIEIQLRYHYLKLYLDSSVSLTDRWLWMARILKSQSTPQQRAHILQLIFFPLNPLGAIDWNHFSGESLSENPQVAALNNIGWALVNLYKLSCLPRFVQVVPTAKDLVDIMQNLVVSPSAWNIESMGHLATFCRGELSAIWLSEMVVTELHKVVCILIEVSFSPSRSMTNTGLLYSILRGIATACKNNLLPNQLIGFMWNELYSRVFPRAPVSPRAALRAQRALSTMRHLGSSVTSSGYSLFLRSANQS